MNVSRYAIATLSLGSCELHRLEDKLRAASSAGFTSVELFVADWEKYLELFLQQRQIKETAENRLLAAKELRSLLDSLHLRVNCVQPLRGVEGILDPAKRQEKFDVFRSYLPICNALDTDLILCCSSIEPDSCGDIEIISRDLCELADIAKEWHYKQGGKLVRVGYEGLSWGTHVDTWKEAWKCVNYSPRSNLGLIVDSFNALAREYADPHALFGLQRSVSASLEFLSQHLCELVNTVPGDKIYLFQVADASLPTPSSPFSTPPSDGVTPKLLPWSRNFRLFPLEQDRGAFLPVAQYTQAVLATGYTGDLSCEVFNASLHDKSPTVPSQHARRAYVSLQKLDNIVSTLSTHSASIVVPREKSFSKTVETPFSNLPKALSLPRVPLAPL